MIVKWKVGQITSPCGETGTCFKLKTALTFTKYIKPIKYEMFKPPLYYQNACIKKCVI